MGAKYRIIRVCFSLAVEHCLLKACKPAASKFAFEKSVDMIKDKIADADREGIYIPIVINSRMETRINKRISKEVVCCKTSISLGRLYFR